MTKYITIKLTEDQINALLGVIDQENWYFDGYEDRAFILRARDKLAKAKTV